MAEMRWLDTKYGLSQLDTKYGLSQLDAATGTLALRHTDSLGPFRTTSHKYTRALYSIVK